MVFGVFSPGRTHCIAPKKLPDKAMSIWNLHKKFQLSSAMGLRDFDLQSQPTLMGGNPLIVVQWRGQVEANETWGPKLTDQTIENTISYSIQCLDTFLALAQHIFCHI